MKRSVSLILIVSLICTLLISCTSSEYSELQKSLDDFFANDKTAFSGSVLVAIDGKIILKKGYGMADYEKQIPNSPETVFKIGSITKQFTSMAVMMLEERGFLSVNDPISKYIPDYKGVDKITIHNLLSMTSGISEYAGDDWYDCERYYTVEELVSRIREKPIRFEAGTKYEYCNSNYILLGYIIEKVSGMEYGDFLEQNIFIPLKMNNTRYDYKEDQLKNKAKGYIRVGDITKKNNAASSIMNMSYGYAAGGLYSTVEDMYKWDRALYTEKLVKRETLDRMFTPNLEGYGYGWIIPQNYRGLVRHDGYVKGFTAEFLRIVDHKATIIILKNEEDLYGSKKINEGLYEIAEKYKILDKVEADK